MNLHICQDDNFIAQSMLVFEKFYPGENVYLMFNKTKQRTYPSGVPLYRVEWNVASAMEALEEIRSKYVICRVLTHGLIHLYSPLLKAVKEYDAKTKVYWIFWGYELYAALAEQGKYRLLDKMKLTSPLTYVTPSPINNLLRKIGGRESRSATLQNNLGYYDYFCFWLKSDYDLLQLHYATRMKFKHFQYGASYKTDGRKEEIVTCEKTPNRILVNHQATMNGNYDTLFDRLKRIAGIDAYDIYAPLSYGSEYVKKEVLKRGRAVFGDRFKPMLDLMPVDEYNAFLSSVPIAIFGQHRQEAAGNIIALLRTGAKVFLREDSPLLSFYREKGYLIYSVEKDLDSMDSLTPLTVDEQMHNMRTALDTQRYYEEFIPVLFDD